MKPWSAPTAVLGRKQLYMLPTRYGLLFTAMLMVLLLAAVNYANGLAYLLTFLVAAIGIVSMLYTHRNLAGLRVVPRACTPVFAGDIAQLVVCLHNDGRLPRLGVALEHAKRAVARVDIAPNDCACLSVPIVAPRRGRLAFPAVVVATIYPLGLVRSWSRPILLEHHCLVYPRPGPVRALPRVPSGRVGERAVALSEGDDFGGVREFRAGDSPWRVDWKSAARGRGLHIKLFNGEGAETVWLDWSLLHDLDVESRLSALCRWVVDAERAQIEYGLRLPDVTLAPARGPAHQRRCLEALALYGT